MGVGYTTLMYDPESLLDGVSEIAACRYDGIEMGLGEVDAIGQDVLADALDEYGLDMYFVMGGWLESDAAAEDAVRAASVAGDLGAEFVGMLPPQRGLIEDESRLESWIAQVCDAADNAGVTPLLHPHGATHIEQPNEIEDWLDRSPDSLNIVWDTAHHYPYGEYYPTGDVTDGIERFADDIAYVHLKDIDPRSDFEAHVDALSSGEFNLANVFRFYESFVDLGEGVIDFRAVHDALENIGYDGHYTIEVENRTTDPLVHARQNQTYWSEITDA